MEVNIQDLIDRLENFKDRIQDYLNEDDDFLLAVVLAVLEEVKDNEN